jgi:hypothetical protein
MTWDTDAVRYRGCVALLLTLPLLAATSESKVDGKFIVAGTDAQLKYARAKRARLDDKGKQGYAVLLSAQPATGDFLEWRTKEPSEKGSFICVLFEQNGAVWVADIAHVKAKSGRFGVVTELQKVAFEVRNGGIAAHITTNGDQLFTDDHYDIDLTFSAPLDK